MKKAVGIVVVLATLLAIQMFSDRFIDAYNYQIVILAGINIILAVSLNLITGITGQFSIGHAGFFAIGAYTCAYVTNYWGAAIRSILGALPMMAQDGLLLLIGLLLAAILAAIAGAIVGIPSLRLRGDYLAIVTLGFGEIIRVLILNINVIGGARGFVVGTEKLSNFFWVYLFVVIAVVVSRNILHSSYGRAFISIRDDEIAAEAMGVDTTRFKVLAFVISSMFAGIAGGLFAEFTLYIHPNSFTFIKSIEVIIMVVIGGLGSIDGAVLGGGLFTVILEKLRAFESLRLVIFPILLILIMIYRPQGILGSRSIFRPRRTGIAK